MHFSEKAYCRLPILKFISIVLSAGLTAGASLAAELSLTRVVLSSGGVGYFEFTGEAKDNDEAAIELPLRQVDDVLKSLLVIDPAGAPSVRLAGRQSLQEIFRNLPFSPKQLSTSQSLLNALQGTRLRIKGATVAEGRVLRAVRETVKLPDRDGVVTRHRVTLATAGGLQQFVLEDVQTIEFLDPEVREQIEFGLQALAEHSRSEQRVLEVELPGQGTRQVTLAYVIPVPLWKVAYRLVHDAADSKTARLQGWAVIDNLSGQDWQDVELVLTSGNPVTFRQRLYGAYYVPRPEIPVEVMGRVLPRMDQGALAQKSPRRSAPAPGRAKSKRGSLGIVGNMASGSGPAMAERAADRDQASGGGRNAALLNAARTSEAMAQVNFRFSGRQNLAHGFSAMLPLIDRPVPAEKIALYQPATHARHPLAVSALTNDGKFSLPPGVVTLYERDLAGRQSFAGDARMSLLPAGERRLLSFALDRRLTIDRESGQTRTIVKGRIADGVLSLSLREERKTVYRIKTLAGETRPLILEHPRRHGWKLVQPGKDGVELAKSVYRIPLHLNAGETNTIEVLLSRPRVEHLRLLGLSASKLTFYSHQGGISDAVRKVFARIGELRRRIHELDTEIAGFERQAEAIFDDQKRIRENLSRLRSNQPLHARYLKKLAAQETVLEQMEIARDKADETLIQARRALDNYVANVNL